MVAGAAAKAFTEVLETKFKYLELVRAGLDDVAYAETCLRTHASLLHHVRTLQGLIPIVQAGSIMDRIRESPLAAAYKTELVGYINDKVDMDDGEIATPLSSTSLAVIAE